MAYDNLDPDADGTVNADVDNQSTNTSQLNNTAKYPSDTTGIKTTIENASDGDRIVLPSDQTSYTVNNPINVSASITITGPGKDSTTGLLQKQNSDDLFYVAGCSPTFQGVIGNGGDMSGYGIHTAGGDNRVGRITIRDTAMDNMYGGYYLNSANVSYIANSGAHSTETSPSLEIGGANANAATIINFDATAAEDGQGIVVDGAYGVNVFGGYVDGSTADGWVLNSNRLGVFGAGGEANANATIRIGSDANYGMVVPGYMDAGIVNDSNSVNVISGEDVNMSFSNGEVLLPQLSLSDDISGKWSFSQDPNDRALVAELLATGAGGVNFRLAGGSGGGNDFENPQSGQGYIATTPDGSAQYRIAVDNSGNLTTEQI